MSIDAIGNHKAHLSPILKWVGGKRQLLKYLLPHVPPNMRNYCEAFAGGGALFFALLPPKAIINDINPELIGVYEVVRDDVEGLIEALAKHTNEAEHFYAVRAWDRDDIAYAKRSKVEKAARLIYLNKTCYNGLYRVNRKGQFNTPFGRYTNPNIINAEALRAVSHYLNSAEIDFRCADYWEVLSGLETGDFVYLDPPYDPVSESSSFTKYAKDGFLSADQVRLRDACDDCHRKGVNFMLSNAATPFIVDLYKDYELTIVHAKRSVNTLASKRGEVAEVLVRNY